VREAELDAPVRRCIDQLVGESNQRRVKDGIGLEVWLRKSATEKVA
jgi:hypothetical protein